MLLSITDSWMPVPSSMGIHTLPGKYGLEGKKKTEKQNNPLCRAVGWRIILPCNALNVTCYDFQAMRWEWSAWRLAWPPLWESWSQPQNSSHRWPPAWVWVSEWVGARPGRATCLLRFHGHWLHLLFPSVGCDPTCHESTSCCHFEILFMHIYLLVPAELVSMLFYENYIFFVCIMGRLLWHQFASPYSEYFLSFRLYRSAGSVSGTSSAQVNMASKYLTSFHCLNLTQTTPCCSCLSVPNSRHV